ASNSALRFGLGTATDAHIFRFANTDDPSNPTVTLYDDQHKLSGTSTSVAAKAPALTINETTSNHTFAMSITRTGTNAADYAVSIDGDKHWTWTFTNPALTNFTFDRVLL